MVLNYLDIGDLAVARLVSPRWGRIGKKCLQRKLENFDLKFKPRLEAFLQSTEEECELNYFNILIKYSLM